jgi:glycosyltransferase involved in cell wall biosynthesis
MAKALPHLQSKNESLDYYYFPNHFGGIGKDGDLMLRSLKMLGNIKIRTFDLANFNPELLSGIISEKAFFVAPAQELMKVKFKFPELINLYKLSSAFIQWELKKIPLEFEWAMEGISKVVVSSDFTKRSIPKRFDAQKICMPNLIKSKFINQRSSDVVTFISMFDAWSYLERKNPYMAIEVYKNINKKFNTRLIIKSSNLDDRPEERKKIIELIGDDPRITLIDKIMIEDEVYELIAKSHCMLSFQRSEGFGRTLLESLCLGTHVISNDYSGCEEFSSVKEFIGCQYNMTPVNGGYPYGDGQLWAETDFSDAVKQANLFCEKFLLGSLTFVPNKILLQRYSLSNTALDLKRLFGV